VIGLINHYEAATVHPMVNKEYKNFVDEIFSRKKNFCSEGKFFHNFFVCCVGVNNRKTEG
jgi:hypothetical protein